MKLFLCILFALFPALAFSQQGGRGGGQANAGNESSTAAGSEQDGTRGFWEGNFAGGTYLVRIDRITTVSLHEYIVDGSTRVVEATVGAGDNLVARFYYMEPVGKNSSLNVQRLATERLQSIAQEAGDRTGVTQGRPAVVKNYPNSTHAKTVEFTLASEDQVRSVYQSISNAVKSNRPVVWSE